jgi:ribosomal protein S6
MFHPVFRIACLTASAIAIPVQTAGLTPDAGSAAQMTEQRVNLQDQLSSAQASFDSGVDSSKQGVMGALTPKQMDPALDPCAMASALVAVPANAIAALPKALEEQAMGLGVALDDLQTQLGSLGGAGLEELSNERWEQGVQESFAMMDAAQSKFEELYAMKDELNQEQFEKKLQELQGRMTDAKAKLEELFSMKEQLSQEQWEQKVQEFKDKVAEAQAKLDELYSMAEQQAKGGGQ